MDTLLSAGLLGQSTEVVLRLLVPGAIGALIGMMGLYLVMRWVGRARLDAARNESERILANARSDSEVTLKKAEVDAKSEHLKGQEQLREESDKMRGEFKGLEKRLAKREDNLEAKLDTLDTKERNLEQAQSKIASRAESLAAREVEADELIQQRRDQLLRVSSMSLDEAKRTVLDDVKHELEHETAELIAKTVSSAKDEALQRSREITLTAIQRYAGEHTSESTVSTVAIPSDEMKGRVIGREGRNIRAFEKATGVDVIVDDEGHRR